MDSTFGDMIMEGWLVIYMDNVLVAAETKEECQERTKQVLKRMEEEDLHLKLAKCTFDQMEVEYLGLTSGQGWRSTHRPHQAECSTRLGTPQIGKSSPIIHQILQFLPEVYPQLLHTCTTSPWLDKKGNNLLVGKGTRQGVHQT